MEGCTWKKGFNFHLSDFDTYDSNGKIVKFFSLILHIFHRKLTTQRLFLAFL